MSYLLLADVTVMVHAMFVLFVVCGGFAVLRWRRLVWLHLPAAIWGGIIEIMGWICPLTHLENHFRRMGGGAGYSGSYISQYLEPILYPAGLTMHVHVILGVGVLLLNTVIYVRMWRHSRHKSG